MSIFNDKRATPNQIATSITKLSVAFPAASVEFFNLLAERLSKKGMSASRLDYAINHIIDTHTYRSLTIADIMSIDKRVEVMSYHEMVNECHRKGCTTNDYAPIKIGDAEKPFWVSKADKAKYKLPDAL